MDNNPFLLCQPDDKKGCSACCGLFNFTDISREHLDTFLGEGSFRKENGWRYTQEECFLEQTTPVRDRTTHICAFQGYLSPGKPGCLVHPLSCGKDERDQSLFGSKVCGNFLCPAYKIFSDEEKRLVIENIDDWYLYTIALIDPYSTRWILQQLTGASRHEKSEDFKGLLAEGLALLADHLKNFSGTVFCYSVPEYNIGSEFFSLTAAESEKARETREAILNLFALWEN